MEREEWRVRWIFATITTTDGARYGLSGGDGGSGDVEVIPLDVTPTRLRSERRVSALETWAKENRP